MSLLVLHMDKFKKDAIRGIQSHNRRERESHSNPDIDYSRSVGNYDLCTNPASNYGEAIQNRIDDLLMVKAVRKDAVHMCGLIVSSDKEFFDKLNADETRRFFEEAAKYLTEFAGRENVISAIVHLDEKTPHMHFLHVPVTPDGRLCAKDIYTKTALKKLQDELPKHLQKCGFQIERGVEQEKGAAKKHLDTREFKQQKEMLAAMRKEGENLRQTLLELQKQLEATRKSKSDIEEELEEQRLKIEESEKVLKGFTSLPAANFFNYKEILAEARERLDQFQTALADKESVKRERNNMAFQIERLLKEREEDKKIIQMAKDKIREFSDANQKFAAHLEKVKAQAKMEMADMNEFIMASGNQLRYQEFLLQRNDERNTQKKLSEEQEKERTRQTRAQSINSGSRMRG